MKILFCGTPDFARTVLESLYAEFSDASFFVLSAPARRQGRGMTLTQPPVAAFALEHGLPLYQPETLKNEAFLESLHEIDPDVAVVAAYGKILPPYFISYPRLGCINVHASLLPLYRGASPIQRSIWDGCSETGVTIMQMDNGLDTGDILLQESIVIADTDDTLSLTEKLARCGGELVCRALKLCQNHQLTPKKQDDTSATYAAKLLREDEVLDFQKPAAHVDRTVRVFSPRPYAYTHLPDGSELKICRCRPTDRPAASPGTVRAQKGRVFVSCGDFELEILRVKPQGKGEMDAASLVNGRKIADGDVLQ